MKVSHKFGIASVMRTSLSVLGAFMLSALSHVSAIGCSCPETFTPPCAFYSRADAVFSGTLRSTRRIGIGIQSSTIGRFQIDQAFKGLSTKEADIEFPYPECNLRLNIGEKYLVYARRSDLNNSSGLVSQVCEGTRLLAHAGKHLDYLQMLSNKKVRQSIVGWVTGIRDHELEGIRIAVKGSQWDSESGVNSEGYFKFEPPKPGVFQVQVSVPLALRVFEDDDLDASVESSGTLIQYTARLKEKECDYREVKVIRIYSSGINGNVVDESGRPIPRLSIQLYPISSTGFSFLAPHTAGTDEAGNYSFKSIKEGKYYLGVNLGRPSDFFAPYPTTFFPGVPTVEKAGIISLEANQQLSLGTLRLPARLVETVVTGRLVWSDGTAVTKRAGDATGPNLYLLDAKNLRSINSARPDGSRTVRIDDDGSFSFVGFEGYSYVIHIHALNSEGKPMHAKHVKFVISKDLQPIVLTLSLPGTGRDIDIIKNELLGLQ